MNSYIIKEEHSLLSLLYIIFFSFLKLIKGDLNKIQNFSNNRIKGKYDRHKNFYEEKNPCCLLKIAYPSILFAIVSKQSFVSLFVT